MASSQVCANSVAKMSERRREEALFFPAMAVLIIVTVVLGFARTFFLAPMYHYQLPNALVALHGAVFSAWIALFAIQATLVPVGHLVLHRRIGVAGAYLLGLVVLLGCLIMLEGVQRDVSRPGLDQARIFSLNLVELTVAVTLLGRGLLLRRDAGAHKRLMLLGTVALLGPAVVRWPFAFVALHHPSSALCSTVSPFSRSPSICGHGEGCIVPLSLPECRSSSSRQLPFPYRRLLSCMIR